MIKSVGIFCAATPGIDPEFSSATRKLGSLLAAKKLSVVYGGGSVGLMGELRNVIKEDNGELIGVLPEYLITSERRTSLDQDTVHVVRTLAERKSFIIENSDAFISLPGGIGTLDELCEVLALKKLRQIRSPIALLNTKNFYAPFVTFLQNSANSGFLEDLLVKQLIVESCPKILLERLLQEKNL